MTKNKLLLLLVLLMTAATGAWAQTETLLTTITATDTGSYSETTPGVVTVTHDNDDIFDEYGWLWYHQGSVTVEAKEGYTITKCVFRQADKDPVTVSKAPFGVNFIETPNPMDPEETKFLIYGDWSLKMNGVSSIEVYGAVANSIVINGTPQVGDKSISLTYHFDPNNIPGLDGSFSPTLKVKCDADNNWDEISLDSHGVSSGTTNISLENLGEFEAGKTYEVCFAYCTEDWVDEVFRSFVPAAPTTYTVSMKDGTEDADKWTINPNPAAEGQTVTATYSGTRRVKSVKAVKVKAIPFGAIKGKFTINDTGKQVYFAKGNLQAVCTSADNNPSSPETFTWQFAENQWDCVGNNAANNSIDGNGSVSAAGTVDLFGWSTAATTYGIHNSTSASDYSGDFVDWGGIIGTGWRTLTKDEWNYLFMTRESGSKVNGMSPSPDNARYTHATINTDNGTGGIKGMILFPDGVTVNYSDATSWGGINQYSNWNGSTKCTTSQWNALAAKGFVFLPTGGVRNGTTITNSNNNGYYWSSYTASPTSGYAHYTRVVPTTEPTTDYDSRKIGISVRLVYDVE